MPTYSPKKFRPLRLVAMCLRSLIQLLNVWPLLLLCAFFISPVGPYLRIQYIYEQRGPARYMLDCQYLGSRGFVHYTRYGECPFIIMLDRRSVQR